MRCNLHADGLAKPLMPCVLHAMCMPCVLHAMCMPCILHAMCMPCILHAMCMPCICTPCLCNVFCTPCSYHAFACLVRPFSCMPHLLKANYTISAHCCMESRFIGLHCHSSCITHHVPPIMHRASFVH